MVEYIKSKRQTVAIILRRGFRQEGAHFFTEPRDPFQFGALRFRKGEGILAHKHLRIKRTVNLVSEVLFIRAGRLKVTFYGNRDKKIASKILNEGDFLLLKNVGHAFKILKEARVIEIKQGPYPGKEKDKRYLKQ